MGCDHLAGYLYEIGAVQQRNGLEPVSWSDLFYWQQCTETDLTPWEQSAIIDASRAYLDGHIKALDINCMAPWMDHTKIDHQALAEKRRRRHAK
jgi:hypothetical protein